MSADVQSCISTILTNSWNVLSQTTFPGTNFSLSIILASVFLSVASIRLLIRLLDLATGEQKGGNNKNIKVSKERKGDTH